MFASGYGQRVDQEILRLLDDVNAHPRYTDRSYKDEEGRLHKRGGFWNNPDRAATTPFTLADARDLRASLKALGLRLSLEQCDVLLSEAYGATNYGSRVDVLEMANYVNANRDAMRAAKRVQRDRRKAAGLCTMQNKGCAGKVPEGRSTCVPCARGATERGRAKTAARSA